MQRDILAALIVALATPAMPMSVKAQTGATKEEELLPLASAIPITNPPPPALPPKPKCELKISTTTVDENGRAGGPAPLIAGLINGSRRERYARALPITLSPARQYEILVPYVHRSLPGMLEPLIVSRESDPWTSAINCKAYLKIEQINLVYSSYITTIYVRFSYHIIENSKKETKTFKKSFQNKIELLNNRDIENSILLRNSIESGFLGTYGLFYSFLQGKLGTPERWEG